MRSILLLSSLVISALAFTLPSSALGQATQPQQNAMAGEKLIVFPFAVAPGAQSPWVGKAVQQNVFTDVIQRTHAHADAATGDPPVNNDEALRRARDANAQFAVTGDVQSAGNDLRITGQVIDVASGNVIGGIKATGRAADLFPLEDSVAAQVLQALPRGLVVAQPQQLQQQPQMQPRLPYVTTAQPPVTPYYSEPAPSYTTYNYTDYYDSYPSYPAYPYDYGYGYYGYPYWGAGLFFFDGGFRHRGFDHGRFDHGRFDHGRFDRGFGGGINIDHGFRRNFGSFNRGGFSSPRFGGRSVGGFGSNRAGGRGR